MKRQSWFRRLLTLFPADFRGEFGSQMEADFDDQRRDAAARGPAAMARLWTGTIAGFLRVGPREHAAQMLADIRHGARLAARQPGSTAASVLVLALGIAAVTGAFTIVDAFLLRPLPFADPDRLVHVWSTHRQTGVETGRSSLQDVQAWATARSVTGVAAFNYTEEDLTGRGRPERISAARVSANVFDVLGVSPQVGRGFAAGEDRPGAAPVAIVSRRFADQRLDGIGAALNRTIEIAGRRHTVVGVMGESFVFPLPVTDVWLPRVFDPAVFTWEVQSLQAVARLAPGATAPAAEQELAALTRSVAAPYGEPGSHRGVRFEPLRNALNFADAGFRIAGPIMLLAASLILLAACANVSSVLLGRAITRAREVAVRSAVGASRLRLFRQFLFESVSMAAAALLIGVLLAQWWLWWIQGLLPLDLYRVGEIGIDPRTFAVACAAAVTAVLVAAGLPAVRFGRTDLLGVLRMDGTSSTVSPRASRLQTALLVAQVTFSVALLASALAALGVVRDLSAREPGFDRARVLTMKFILGTDRYPQPAALRAFHDRALAETRAVPGVESAALVNHLPLNHETSTLPYARPGEQVARSAQRRTTIEVSVSPEYFETMGISLLQGRDFDARDAADGLPVALVNRTLASRVWGTDAPIGRQIELGTTRVPVTIVGVVEDSRQRELVGEPEAIIYRPLAQVARRHARLVVRTSGDPNALIGDVQAAVWRADALLPLTEVRSLDQVVVDFLLPQRAMTISMTNMGITGLLVTAIGLYGVLAVFVAQRRREIGVRMALGATRHGVVRAIVWRSVRTTGIGLALGLTMSAFMTQSLAAVLPGAKAADPLAIGGTLAVLTLIAVAASFVPARRATRVDPLIVLRTN
jgi:putative ABC transport system permease protein